MIYLLFLALFVGNAVASPTKVFERSLALSNSQTSITQLFQNNLNGSDDLNHRSIFLLDPMTFNEAVTACESLNENLASESLLRQYQSDFILQLSYVEFAGRAAPNQLFWTENSTVQVSPKDNSFIFGNREAQNDKILPALCTQSDLNNQPATSVATATNRVLIEAEGNTFNGYRNLKSFRFLGIPFADQPARFTYSTVTTQKGQLVDASEYGSECAQLGVGSEDCLFLNIQTPFIPKAGSKENLRPVAFWIYGGGFVDGSGSDPLSDGSNMASRDDIVTVTINYRLSTLGFLAVPGTDVKGNFGIGDQITALEWTIANIASFGGDASRITIFGESAGAGSVKALLGSLQAIGKFQGAIAMSNLGGGQSLGLTVDYATPYSSYYTIEEYYALQGPGVFTEAGCNQTTSNAQIACLKTVSAEAITTFANAFSYVVQDGVIVNTPELLVNGPTKNTAHVPVMFGNVENDGASFVTYAPEATSLLKFLMEAMFIDETNAQSVIDSGLFPYFDTGNVTADSFNVTQRVATDLEFRCVDQAIIFAGATTGAFEKAYYYQMDRTIAGYNPNNVDSNGPIEPGFPFGDPELPYYKLHGSDMPWVFGNISPLRDEKDLLSVQLSSSYFASFIRTGDPNPEAGYLATRGYQSVIQGIKESGPWNQVTGEEGPIHQLDYPSVVSGFLDMPQCDFLQYPITFYTEK